MKKTTPKPANWQDFESLCKFLWGEIWEISDKIKKNGRLGQTQHGVDVYGVPKGRSKYSGIQCKGKDEQINSVLTVKEIDLEISRAKLFKPGLETFIFATTANKDVAIEQYVREKDLESRATGGFEILIYCWEDIADLIEVNRNTFNYYVLQKQFKSNYGFDFTFADGSREFTIKPTFKKVITEYKLKEEENTELPVGFNFPDFKSPLDDLVKISRPYNVNSSWATFSITIANSGSEVIEDYKIYITPERDKFRDLSASLGGIIDRIDSLKFSPLYVFEDEKYAVYSPKDNAPLIQKDSRRFDLHILANRDQYELKIEYELLARNFNQTGELILKVDPTYRRSSKTIRVDSSEKLKELTVKVEDYMTQGNGLF